MAGRRTMASSKFWNLYRKRPTVHVVAPFVVAFGCYQYSKGVATPATE